MDTATMDRALEGLSRRKAEWVSTGALERQMLLLEVADRVLPVAEDWVRLACRVKGIPPSSPLAGEEWVSGPMPLVRFARLVAETIRDLDRRGGSRLRVREGPGGRGLVHVFPRSTLEWVAYSRMRVDIWLRPGAPPTQGRIYREKALGSRGLAAARTGVADGRLALVLGAGNVSSIGPLDVLGKLFAEDEVVALKLNPVNAYLAPVFEHVLRPLIERGVLRILPGGAAEGQYLAEHPLVESIHMTGATRTHDAIVWGATPEEQQRRRAAGTPRLQKPITSELGCITPVLVVPGPWSASDIRVQARHVASMVAHNASFNCTAGKVLLLARGWAQREAFLDAVEDALRAMPPRRAYYPGAEERHAAYLAAYPAARLLGLGGASATGATGSLPWTLVRDVPPEPGQYAFREEPFCGVLAEVTLDAGGADAFLDAAVPFVNDHVWGTLSCVLLVDERTRRAHGAALGRALADLRYGNIGVNAWTGANFAFGVNTWGGYPGHTLADVGSGIGVVHNALLLDHPEKSVLHAPFRLWPTPIWFADHGNLANVGRRLVRFERRPGWLQVPPLALAAMNR